MGRGQSRPISVSANRCLDGYPTPRPTNWFDQTQGSATFAVLLLLRPDGLGKGPPLGALSLTNPT